MALLSELVKAVADVEGIDQTSVGIFARAAREAGLISQKGRGRGAAHMTVRDATNLLIAVNGSQLAKDASVFVRHFRELQLTSKRGLLADWDDDVGIALSNASKFGEALEALIRLSQPDESGGSMMDACLNAASKDLENVRKRRIEVPEPYVIIEFCQPYVEVSIEIKRVHSSGGRWPELWDTTSEAIFTLQIENPKGLKLKDRQIKISITQATIKRVAELGLQDAT